ncbi:MAG: hypothetical protein HYW02_07500 [Deltaproteobacteria bacterium]|nr:hypothetical protein [Deltaproteobacteria bacterium]MBI2501283.1 hypothetical protein [Deltaproteobacteria bacterium]
MQAKKIVLPPEESIAAESFEMDQRTDHSILVGRFIIRGQVMLVSHSQWEGDSHPLTVTQRREILRRTIQERLRKLREYRKN